MELVDGKPFSESLDAAKMSVKERLELFVQVCRAVQHAHDRGIIHRDLKPSNVLVTRVDGRPTAKVIDFGLAKSIDPEQRIADTELTIHGHVMGTMNYMSPEQAAGDPVDGQADVYSLGVMLYESLVGSTPIEAHSLKGLRPLDALELVRNHTASKPSSRLNQSGPKITEIAQRRSTSPTSLRSILTGELDWVVLQAIEKDKSRRYSTVQSLADDVERYLNDEAVHARPPSLVYTCSKFVRRNRTMLSFTSIVAIALLAVGILLPLLWRSQQESALSKLEQAVLTNPGDFQLTVGELETQREVIEQISAIDTQRGVEARRRLSDSLQREDCDHFIELVLNSPSIRSLKPMISMAIPGDRVFAAFSRMWKSSLGMRLAEDMAFERLNLRERTIGPIHVAAYQFAADGAFANRLAGTDSELIFSAMQELLDVWLEGDFNLSDLLGMWAAWQGYSSSVSTKLPSQTRAKFHYMLGHKRLLNGDKQSAREQLLAAQSEIEDGTIVSELAGKTLALLDSSSGVLEIECDNEIADGFEIYDESRALVPANPADSNRKRRLAAGTYTIRNDAIDWSSPVDIRLGKTSAVEVRWKWSPIDRPGKLKGLLSHPAKLPEHKNWQLVQTSMEARCFDLAWSPDGKSIAIVGDEYLRIADSESFEYTDAIPINGEQLRTVSWSSKGVLATGTADGRVFLLNAETGERLETATLFPARVSRVRWNPSGDLLAVGGEASDAYIYDASGKLQQILRGDAGWVFHLGWSPDGEFLAVGGFGQVRMIGTATWELALELESEVCTDLLWTKDSTRFVMLDNKRFRFCDTSGKVISEQPVGPANGATSIIWGKDGASIFASGGGAAGVFKWNIGAGNGESIELIQNGGYAPILLSPDEQRIAKGNPNGCAIFSRQFERELGCIGKHLQVRLRNSDYCDSRGVLSVVDFYKGEATVFDFAANSIRTLDSSDRYYDARWSRDGDLLAACTQDGTVVLFDETLEVVAQLDVSENPLRNIEWFRDDENLVVSSERGELHQLAIGKDSEGNLRLSSKTSLLEGDSLPTNWEGSRLVASPDSLAGAFYRNEELYRFSFGSIPEISNLERFSACTMHSFNYIENERILSNNYDQILSHESSNDWLAVSKQTTYQPTCFVNEPGATVLLGTRHGCICRYNFDTGEVTKLVDTGREVYDLHLTGEDEVLAISLYGVIRKINIRSGEVLQLAVVTRDAPPLLVSGGGKLLSSPESLSEFSCIVERAGKTNLVPATQLLVEE